MKYFNIKNLFLFIFITFFFIQKIYPEEKSIVFPITLNHQAKTFYGDGKDSIFNLGNYRIIKDSVRVCINGFQLKEEKFKIDYDEHNVTFFNPPPKGSIIKIYFKVIPIQLNNSYYHRTGFSKFETSEKNIIVSSPIVETPIEKEQDKSSFEKSGSLIRGISINTDRGVTMNSGFRMDFKGDIGKNLEVIASLTDQTSPLQPEGNTQTLNEIDKIFFKIQGKGYETTLGDIDIENNGTEFSNYHKKLQGISGEGIFGSQKIKFLAATSRGKFNANRFYGKDGNQGPYQLLGKNGETYIVVIGGTEKVWVDGELMKRGEDNDYVIEYANGQITFTRHKLITDESRIEVDFQYTDGNSKENVYSVKTEGKLYGEKLSYNLNFIKENNARDKYNSFSLSDIDYNPNSLNNLQKSVNNQFQNGAIYVGPKNGNYQKLDSEEKTYYSYVGENNGEYKLKFSEVGKENGEYEFLGDGIYKWVGKGNGNYLPIIFVGEEKGNNVGDVQINFKPNEIVSFNSEIALSSNGNNTSNPPFERNNGNAMTFGLSVAPKNLLINGLNLGNTNFSLNFKKRDKNFYSIDRTREVEFNRKWDLKEDEINGDNELELKTQISPKPYISFLTSLGKFAMGESSKSGRNSMEVKISHKSLPHLSYIREFIKSNRLSNNYSGEWIRERGNLIYSFGSFKPSFDFEREIKKEKSSYLISPGFGFTNIGGRLEYKKGNLFTGFGSFRMRKDNLYDNQKFSPSSNSFTDNFGFMLQKGSNLTASAEFTNRRKRFEDNREDITTNLGDMRLKFSTKNQGIILQNNYQLSDERTPKKKRVYFQVEEGKGDYFLNEQTGEYYPDINGNYITRTFTTNEFNSVSGIKFGSTIDVNFSKFLKQTYDNKLFKIIQNLKTKSIFRIEEKSKRENQNGLLTVPTFSVQSDSATILGNISLLQDFVLFENMKNFYVRMRLNYSSSINNQFIERNEKRDFFEKSIQIKSNFIRNMGVLVDLNNKSLLRIFSDNPGWERDIKSNDAKIEFFYKPKLEVEYKTGIKFGKEKNTIR
jgi:hypothetical protein